jgi:poly-gamma-glutamate synthesis protein (capsule biosynthesis protein)
VQLGQTSEPKAAPAPLRLRFVGDVIFGRYRKGHYRPLIPPDARVFADVRALLAGDWVVANLETPLLREIPARDARTGYFFAATPELAAPLVQAGFDAVSLANNHAADLGTDGLGQTPVLLRELGIEPLGAARAQANAPYVRSLEVHGTRIAVLSITTRANFELPKGAPNVVYLPEHVLGQRLGPLVQQARPEHDLVVVLVHWGVEYARYPEMVQRNAARALIDAGADLVIGHHPHVLQEVELYHGGIIAYSLGNFLFGNTAPDVRLTGVLGIDVSATDCRLQVRFDPAVMRRVPFIHPEPATGAVAEQARRRILPLATEQREQWRREEEALVTEVRRDECGVEH